MPPLEDMEPSEVTSLNRVSCRLFVQLPRLMCLVRQWKAAETGCKEEVKELSLVANELATFEDHDAEQWLLARTQACLTQDSATAKIISHSFCLPNAREAATALCYWQTRIMALKLLDTVEMSSPSHRAAEQDRMAINILMTCEYIESCGYCATAPVAIALVTVWLVLRSCQDGQEICTNELAESILKTLARCWSGAAIGGNRAELDKVANVLVGGKLEGYLCDSVMTQSGNRGG